MQQNMNTYTEADRLVWKTLFERQVKNLETKGSELYHKALTDMQPVLNADNIPEFEAITNWFKQTTGWEIAVVPGMIPVDEFFDFLAAKKFCSSTWLRGMHQLDYLEEPDMFHDIFGHIPLLSHPQFSEFAHQFGKLGKCFKGNTLMLERLQRLYWFTIEFGVIRENDAVKVYGAGIISSFGETNRVANLECNILPFDIDTVLEKAFQNDVLQEDYFEIESIEVLNEAIKQATLILNRKIEI